MPFWGNDIWVAKNRDQTLVDNFDEKNLSEGAYKLALGDEAIISSGDGDKLNKSGYVRMTSNVVLMLEPGQFAYLITKDKVHLPKDAIGFINVDTEAKFHGLTNISGFHVDPEYNGRLIFTVFNAGPSAIPLPLGHSLFKMWLSDFKGSINKPKDGYNEIPKEWVSRLHGSYPSPFALSSKVEKIEDDITKLQAQRRQILLGVGLLFLVLLPFVIALYAAIFAEMFNGYIKIHG